MSYLQLAHNEWDPAAKTSRTKVLYSFGRADQLDRAGDRAADHRADPAGRRRAAACAARIGRAWSGCPGWSSSSPARWAGRGCSTGCGTGSGSTPCCAASRPGPGGIRWWSGCCSRWSPTGRWRRPRSWPPPRGSPTTCTCPASTAVSDDACYRAMDWLITIEDKLARGVFDQVAHLLNLEVDLIFFDTTSTYFETEQPDEPVWRDEHGTRRRHPTPTPHTTPPRAATAAMRAGAPAGATGAGGVPQPTGSPRTPATTCRRWWSAWP